MCGLYACVNWGDALTACFLLAPSAAGEKKLRTDRKELVTDNGVSRWRASRPQFLLRKRPHCPSVRPRGSTDGDGNDNGKEDHASIEDGRQQSYIVNSMKESGWENILQTRPRTRIVINCLLYETLKCVRCEGSSSVKPEYTYIQCLGANREPSFLSF